MINNEKKYISSYNNKIKKGSEKVPVTLYNKSLLINRINLLELINDSPPKKLKNNLLPLYQNSFLFNNKLKYADTKRTNNSYNNKILKDVNLIKNKIYTEKIDNNTTQNIKTAFNKNNELKNKFLLYSMYEGDKNHQKKEFSLTKNIPFLVEYKNKKSNISNNLALTYKNKMNDELKYLQKQYYLIDKVNNNKEENKNNKKIKYSYNDYADKTMIYNHPQLYYINNYKKMKLPNIDFVIKRPCLTEAIPDKNEALNYKDLMRLKNYIKMKKIQKPIFIA